MALKIEEAKVKVALIRAREPELVDHLSQKAGSSEDPPHKCPHTLAKRRIGWRCPTGE